MIKPCLVVESDGLDNEGVSFPVPAGVTDPGFVAVVSRIRRGRNPSPRVNPFGKDYDRIGRLHNLKRVGKIDGSRKACDVTLLDRICSQTIVEILFLLR